MNLSDIKVELEKIMTRLAIDNKATLLFDQRQSNYATEHRVMLSCSVLPIEPYLSTFREATSQFILQVDYICERDNDKAVEAIMEEFTIDTKIAQDVIVYKPSSVSQWLNVDSKRVAIISIYFQYEDKL